MSSDPMGGFCASRVPRPRPCYLWSSLCRHPTPMPPQELPPGLYDHPLSAAAHQVLASQPQALHQLEPLDPAEAPQRLARYLRQLSEIALAALPEAQRQQQQLALVNRIVAWLQELRGAPLLPNQAPLTRPLIPLADGTLLINAPSEPSVGLALQAEVPSADRPS